MHQQLLVAGSNSGFQLGLGHDRDANVLSQAMCLTADTDPTAGFTSFPPAKWTVKRLSSGANHTLALLEAQSGHEPKQLWATGFGSEGQLGKGLNQANGPIKVFQPIDWANALALDGFVAPSFDAKSFELKDVVCGWNCTYVVLEPRRLTEDTIHDQDAMFSFGHALDNTFGELGVAPSEEPYPRRRCAHKVSFDKVVIEAGLSTQTALRITALATGLRHVVAEIKLGPDMLNKSSTLIVGWGSARHGQIGHVPEAGMHTASGNKRPGSSSAVVYGPQCIMKLDLNKGPLFPSILRAGRAHSVVLTRAADGRRSIYGFGSDRQGQLALTHHLSACGVSADNIIEVACNWNSTQIQVKDDSSLTSRIFGSGSNSRGQLGTDLFVGPDRSIAQMKLDHMAPLVQMTTSRKNEEQIDSIASAIQIHKLVCGSEHSLLLVGQSATGIELDEVWGYGWNEHGNLAQGHDDETDRKAPVPILSLARSVTTTSDIAAMPMGSLSSLNPINVWAGFGTTFVLVKASKP